MAVVGDMMIIIKPIVCCSTVHVRGDGNVQEDVVVDVYYSTFPIERGWMLSKTARCQPMPLVMLRVDCIK